MELDLYDELMELYIKNKYVKGLKNWEELLLATKKWYNPDFRKFQVIGDDIEDNTDITLESLHSSNDFCFGIRDNILFYRTCLLFRGSATANVNKFYRVNYSNFDSIDVTNRYWNEKDGFKGSPIILDDALKVFNDINQLLQERFKISGKSKKTAQKREEVNGNEELEKPKKNIVEDKRIYKREEHIKSDDKIPKELDLYDEIMELYYNNRAVKGFKNWEELTPKLKWYESDFRKFQVVGDRLGYSELGLGVLGSIHSPDDFCFGLNDEVLFYRTHLLFRGDSAKDDTIMKYYRVNYSNFGRYFVGNGYEVKRGKFKRYPNMLDDTRKVFNEINQLIKESYDQLEEKKRNKKAETIRRQKITSIIQEVIRFQKLKNSKENILNKLDQDGNGVLDIIEGSDYMKLLKKHQRQIKEIDRNYIQRFIQVSNFLKSQSETLQEMFTRIQKVRNQQELESLVGLLKNLIHTYEQILFHSLNMIVSLVEEDDLTFYEIYESFDKLHIFDSAWEKQVSQQLSDINLSIIDLMSSVDSMNADILNGLSELSYITEESNRNLVNQLGEIDSSIKVNNFLSGIQTYQLYKINKNTRSLRS